MSSKSVTVRVTMMDSEMDFPIQSTTTGKQLFDQVANAVGLREVWFFGLQYTDSEGDSLWIKQNKKVLKHDIQKENPLQLRFKVKFYPEDVGEELLQDVSVRLFYLHVKDAILSDTIYCQGETSVYLASYAVQVHHGDYNQKTYTDGFLANECLLPQRVIDLYNISKTEWDKSISTWWQEHRGMRREVAMMKYLKIAQRLEMYGINYFEISNKKGSKLLLGVDALGVNIYEPEDKLIPKINFPMSEIKNISFSERKFTIKLKDAKSPDFVFRAPCVKMNKHTLAICQGNYELFIRRRNPATIDVQQMKVQSREELKVKKQEREKLQLSEAARESAEEEKQEYEGRMKVMQEEVERLKLELMDAQEIIRRLEEQLKQLQASKEELELRQNELYAMLSRLDDIKKMEAFEKAKFEEEIMAKQAEVQRIQDEVNAKDEDTKCLQNEVEEARRKQNQATAPLLVASTTSQHPNDADAAAVNVSIELIKERNKRHLQAVKEYLAQSRDETKETANEKLHREGRDKFNTLRLIKKGNTKTRIMQFENL